VRIAHEGAAQRRTAPPPLGESVEASMDRAMREGIPVIDPKPPQGTAFPIKRGDRGIGAVYFVHPAASGANGEAFEVLRLVAAHVGAASVSLRQRQEASASPFGIDSVPGTMSLRDAKFEFESRLLQVRLDGVRGNVASAARSLDMDRGQLSRLMKKHSLDRAAFRARDSAAETPVKPQETSGSPAQSG
jgi:hypothetical protein